MFLRNDHGLDLSGGGAALSFGRAPAPPRKPTLADRLARRFPDFELTPDLGSRIGSRDWFRGVATCAGLIAVTCMLAPATERPLHGYVPAPLKGADFEEVRALAVTPLALGANSGRHMGATKLVSPLADTPERPRIEGSATLYGGNGLASLLQRSGVGRDEAGEVADLVKGAISLGDIPSGTRIDYVLGRRADKSKPRPLENLAFRARFDLNLAVERAGDQLALKQLPIAIDSTPLRVRGDIGGSLYRSARAAGVPAKLVEQYIKAVASRGGTGRMGSGEFELIAERQRAATGEVKYGNLLYGGLYQGKSKLQLVRWDRGGKTQWLDGTGRGEQHGTAAMPVTGRLTSTFGRRRHPLLGYTRMHEGIDLAAPSGTPIRAAMDGVVAMAGRKGGYGNYVRLNHGGGLATGYGHMSRIAVRPGAHVSRGQVIGYVGSTGLSTGPHLHYELWKNGVAVNPGRVSFSSVQQLAGSDLREFKARLSRLMAVPVGGGVGGSK